jgi:hypothetical protein
MQHSPYHCDNIPSTEPKSSGWLRRVSVAYFITFPLTTRHPKIIMMINYLTMKIRILLIIMLVCTLSCQPKSEKQLPKINETPLVNSLEIENDINDSIEIDLGEIADNLQIVSLETLESVIMGGIYSMVIDENYLVIGTEREYFLFDKKGKFIRRLLKTGRGPDEFISPMFSQVVRKGIVYFSDMRKSKKYLYCLDLANGNLDRIPRPNSGYVQCLIPDTDSTLLVISEDFAWDPDSHSSATMDYSLIRQDFKGKLLDEISLGIFKGVFPFLPTRYSMFINDKDTLISNPRFDTLYRFSNFKIQPIWHNTFRTNYDNQLSKQKIPNASLVHYSDSSILMEKYITDINVNRIWNRNNQLLIMDRVNNKVKVIKKLYFKDIAMPIGFSGDIQLSNDQFCIVLKAKDVNRMLMNPLFNKSISDIIVLDPPRTTRPVTDFDNPFLLIGKFK